jgi:hypothetical protein
VNQIANSIKGKKRKVGQGKESERERKKERKRVRKERAGRCDELTPRYPH